jgi:excisionase family DNA binding protein
VPKKTGSLPAQSDTSNRAARRSRAPKQNGSADRAAKAITDKFPRLTYRKGEAAEALGVSRWHVNKLIDAGQLGVVDLEGVVVIPAAELERYLATKLTRRVSR